MIYLIITIGIILILIKRLFKKPKQPKTEYIKKLERRLRIVKNNESIK